NGILAPVLATFEQLRSLPTMAIDAESFRKASAETGALVSQDPETERNFRNFVRMGIPRADALLAAWTDYRVLMQVISRETLQFADLGRPARLADVDAVEQKLKDAYRTVVRDLKRLDPGFEASGAAWLAGQKVSIPTAPTGGTAGVKA